MTSLGLKLPYNEFEKEGGMEERITLFFKKILSKDFFREIRKCVSF